MQRDGSGGGEYGFPAPACGLHDEHREEARRPRLAAVRGPRSGLRPGCAAVGRRTNGEGGFHAEPPCSPVAGRRALKRCWRNKVRPLHRLTCIALHHDGDSTRRAARNAAAFGASNVASGGPPGQGYASEFRDGGENPSKVATALARAQRIPQGMLKPRRPVTPRQRGRREPSIVRTTPSWMRWTGHDARGKQGPAHQRKRHSPSGIDRAPTCKGATRDAPVGPRRRLHAKPADERATAKIPTASACTTPAKIHSARAVVPTVPAPAVRECRQSTF